MSENFKEPEEKEEIVIEPDYNPLNEPINEKPYSRPNVTIDPKDLQGEIPEPDFVAPPMAMEEPEKNNDKVKEEPKQPREKAAPKPPPKEYEAFNQDMNELSKKDARKATKYAATMIMQGYELMHHFANKAVAFPKKKINALVQKGELDLSLELPFDETGETITVAEFIRESDEQNAELFTVSDEFKSEAMPLLEKVLEKRKIGMTDEQMLGFVVAKDVGIKMVQFGAAKSMQKDMLKMWVEMSKQQGGYSTVQQQRPQPQPQAQPQPKTPPPANDPTDYVKNIYSKTDEEIMQEEAYKDLEEEEILSSFDEVPSVNDEVNRISGGEVKTKAEKAVIISETSTRRGKGRPRKNQ